MIKEKICNYCNEESKFGGRVNGGNNYYCIKCISKIEESKIDFWKDCSFEEFLQNFLQRKGRYPEHVPYLVLMLMLD